MKTYINSRDFEITDGIKAKVERELQKATKYLSGNSVDVYIKKEGKFNIVDMTVRYRGADIVASDKDYDFYSAVDSTVIKLIDNIKKVNSKKNSRKNGVPIDMLLTEHQKKEENIGNLIVKRKHFDMKPMHEAEAILQMDTLGHQSFMFFNADTNTMSMLYKRKDGKFGLID